MGIKKYISKEAALAQLQKFCAYRERAHSEVRYKLISLGIYGDDLEDIMTDLISDNFLNEERFACAYVSGKFRIKRWGRNKIRQGLKQKQVSDYCIRKGMEEIDDEEYIASLNYLLEKKKKLLPKQLSDFDKKGRLAKFMMGKGYEGELIWDILKDFK